MATAPAAGTVVRVVNPRTSGHVGTATVAEAELQPSTGEVAVWLQPSIRPGKDRDLATYPPEWLVQHGC